MCLLSVSPVSQALNVTGIVLDARGNSRIMELITRHRVSTIVAVVSDAVVPEFLPLLETSGNHLISRVSISNIPVSCCNRDMWDLLTDNFPNSYPAENYIWVKIDFNSLASLRKLMRNVLEPNQDKNMYVLPSVTENLYQMLSYDVLFNHEGENAKCGSIPCDNNPYFEVQNLLFDVEHLPHEKEYIIYQTSMVQLNSVTRLLRPYGNETCIITDLIPILSFDIETIANDLFTVPRGLDKNEKMVSFAIYTEFGGKKYTWLHYLQPSMYQSHAHDVKCFVDTLKQKMHIDESEELDIELHLQQFSNETDLLYSLLELLVPHIGRSEASIMSYLIPNQAQWPYFLVCHNLIDYDLPFLIWRNFLLDPLKHHSNQSLKDDFFFWTPCSLNRNEMYKSINSFQGRAVENWRFAAHGFSIDSLLVLKQQAEDTEKLNLDHLTTKYLPVEQRKLQEFSVTGIRIPYVYDKFKHDFSNAEIFTQMGDIFFKTSLFTAHATFSCEESSSTMFAMLYKNQKVNTVQVSPFFTSLVYQFYDVYSLFHLTHKTNIINYSRSMAMHTLLPIDVAGICKSSTLITNVANVFSLGNFFLFSDIQSNGIVKCIGGGGKCDNPDKPICVYPIFNGVPSNRTEWYPGALVLAAPGLYQHIVQYDWRSFYPSMEITFAMAPDNTMVLNCKSLHSLLCYLHSERAAKMPFHTFVDFMLTRIFSVFVADDDVPSTDLSKQYKETGGLYFLDDYTLQIGRLIITHADLEALSPGKALLIYMNNGHMLTSWVVPSILKKFYTRRVDIKRLLKDADFAVKNPHLKTLEHAIKILINSMYGMCKHLAQQVAIAITLFCRKTLIHLCRVAPSLYLLYAMDRDIHLPSMPEGVTRESILQHLNAVRRLSPFNFQLLESYEADGCKLNDALSKYTRRVVVDGDTDGVQICHDATDTTFNKDTFTENYLNLEMKIYCGVRGNNLQLEADAATLLGEFKKKRYFLLLTPLQKVLEICKNLHAVDMTNMNIFKYKEVNLGRNAIPDIRYIFKYTLNTLVICYYIASCKVNVSPPDQFKFTEFVAACFDYLSQCRNLTYPLRLTKITGVQNQRRRFIESLNGVTGSKVSVYYIYNTRSKSHFDIHLKGTTDSGLLSSEIYYPEYLKNYIKTIMTMIGLFYPELAPVGKTNSAEDLHKVYILWKCGQLQTQCRINFLNKHHIFHSQECNMPIEKTLYEKK